MSERRSDIRPCGNPECSCSSGVHEWDDGVSKAWPGYFPGFTFGSGEPGGHGYWEIPCSACARAYELAHPEYGPCWPFADEQDRLAAWEGKDRESWKPKGVPSQPNPEGQRAMSTDTKQYPIFTCSAWGTSPRMAADSFAAEHWPEPRKVAEFRDGTFTLAGGTRTYKIVTQPGVPLVSEATHGVVVEGEGR